LVSGAFLAVDVLRNMRGAKISSFRSCVRALSQLQAELRKAPKTLRSASTGQPVNAMLIGNNALLPMLTFQILHWPNPTIHVGAMVLMARVTIKQQ